LGGSDGVERAAEGEAAKGGLDFVPEGLADIGGQLVGGTGAADLEGSESFKRVRSLVPGGDTGEQLGLIQKSIGSVSSWMGDFTSKHDLNPGKVLGSLKGFLDVTDDRLDYVAAFLDLTTNYYEHTGIQSVARSLIQRAVNEI